MTKNPHIPVMLSEVLHFLAPRDDAIYVDGTFGLGGYTQGILEAANCVVYAFDRDPQAHPWAERVKKKYGDRFTFILGCFSEMKELLAQHQVQKIDGIALDLGVSSVQLDQAERGFSFRFEGPLDMRMGSKGLSAADVVNTFEEEELARIIFQYGEERFSRKIAKKIVETRKISPILTTTQLADLVRSVVRRSPDGIDPATRTFQALRIYVNDELKELEQGLEAAEDLLNPGGRLVVVSFHSLEDRMVKHFFRAKSGHVEGSSRHLPYQVSERKTTFKILTGRAAKPSQEEGHENPRARSARLRAGEKITAEVHP